MPLWVVLAGGISLLLLFVLLGLLTGWVHKVDQEDHDHDRWSRGDF